MVLDECVCGLRPISKGSHILEGCVLGVRRAPMVACSYSPPED